MLTETPTYSSKTKGLLAGRLWIVLGAGVAYILFALFWPASHARIAAIADIICCLIPALAGCWVFWDCWKLRGKAFAKEAPREVTARWRAALFLGLGAFAYGAGTFIWTYYELGLKREIPFPSWADAGYLLCYPFLFLGVLFLPSRPLAPAMRWRVLMDSFMTITALVTFSWYFLLGPIVLAAPEASLGVILGAAYPISDLVALFCLLVLTGHADEQPLKGVVRLLVFGILAVVCADVPFGYLTLHNLYQTGQLTDMGWLLGWGLIALSGSELLQVTPQSQATEPADVQRTAAMTSPLLWRAMIPYALIPCVGALIVYMLKHHPDANLFRNRMDVELEIGVYVGSGLLIALMLLRQIFVILENNTLNHDLRSAYRELEEKNRRLQSLATTDGMTGLSNHRDFQERLRVELSEAERHGASLSVMLLDVDHFKLYNDSFGHPAGDEVLRTMATVLRDSIRDGDLAARYGGEEFALLLPGADAEQARATAERVRSAVSAHQFPNRQITVSIGVTDIQIAGTDPEALIASADTALYAAKHTGRNRWILASDPESLFSAA
ncbi:hypothetical protein CCAX7_53600 [Capsulimonas corticalis]|uniref:Uncharacterized protein n=1 Tax=Capsulimonas corticalis TaxID=2219043 RepID=A0A402CNQ8_9BACT|nr:GGDEF domain-containing protein [Capsulimonas corticalis]BDI33309.1 hypothetical protein CCAX7_53600 [Capsulimonas corticalis]